MNSGHRQSVVTDLGREWRTLHSQCVVWALHWEKSPQLSSLPPAAERSSLVPKRTSLSTLQVLVTFNIRWQTQRYDGAPSSWYVDLQVTSGADRATHAFWWHTHVTGYFFSRVTTLKGRNMILTVSFQCLVTNRNENRPVDHSLFSWTLVTAEINAAPSALTHRLKSPKECFWFASV